jgi:hypothetical protein
MKKTFWIATLVVAFFSISQRAEATTACYSWSCDEITKICSFNSSCSSWTGSLYRFSWDFGDGTGTFLTGSSTINHTYTTPPYPYVKLTVIPLSSSTADVTCQIVVWNNVGPTQNPFGNCP